MTDGRDKRQAAERTTCLSCRVIGTAVCLGAGACVLTHARGLRGVERFVGHVFSGGFFTLAIARAVLE